MATLELGDLSDEIILKVLGFLDIKNLLRVGPVSNRLRSNISINLTKVQVNLCQKLLFLHQLTHNMTKGCSWNYHEQSFVILLVSCKNKCF